jgi:hypothetical protein
VTFSEPAPNLWRVCLTQIRFRGNYDYHRIWCSAEAHLGLARVVAGLDHRRRTCVGPPAPFAPIFFRNAIKIALPVMVCRGIHAAFKDGDELEADIDSGVVKNVTSGKSRKAEALPPNIQHILKQGGLVEVTQTTLAARAA